MDLDRALGAGGWLLALGGGTVALCRRLIVSHTAIRRAELAAQVKLEDQEQDALEKSWVRWARVQEQIDKRFEEVLAENVAQREQLAEIPKLRAEVERLTEQVKRLGHIEQENEELRRINRELRIELADLQAQIGERRESDRTP
jgi:uncharacterized sporulation protein YeaH/YhbH (DUF444 family)